MTLVGVSLKMYFGFRETLDWCAAVADLAATHPAVTAGAAQLFVIPTAPAIPAAIEVFRGSRVQVGAQDVSTHDVGAFTGDVSPRLLAELGCTYAEIGHAERRQVHGETDEVAAAKVAAALRNNLTPVLCIGETVPMPARAAAATCVRQLSAGLAAVGARGERVVVAYEPVWAIGAAQPAPPDHIRAVCDVLREAAAADPSLPPVDVIYGGSARPGLLAELGSSVDGLFLGRFAHDPAALRAVLDELEIRSPR
ncbi:MAG: triosephosphate isomerase [Actinomycetota bacterium]|jgi:triosephosphate isomerase|nr:triosephosphate isomerase [Actinomycetota bacterium]